MTDAGRSPALLRYVESRSPAVAAVSTAVMILALGWVDVVTGWEMSFSIFYLVPVALGSWRGGTRMAALLALVCAIAWFTADRLAGHVYSRDWIPYWNTLVRLGLFLALGLTLATLKQTLDRANQLARIDALTGLANKRAFREQLEYHIQFANRYEDPLTLAFLDLDHFKVVNDTYGHPAGDEALVAVARVLNDRLRGTEVVARIGGDEFAVLLPRTDAPGATRALEAVRTQVETEMHDRGWPITTSIGVVTCRTLTACDDLLAAADRTLYRAKTEGRNRITSERIG